MTIEKISQEDLLVDFRERYQKIIDENQSLTQKIRTNEAEALKLLGAIETLQYLTKEPEEETSEE